MKDLVYKLLDEVDVDIKDAFIKQSDIEHYEMWEITQNPILSIIEWQRMRDFKNIK